MSQQIPKTVSKASHSLDSPYSTCSIAWPKVTYQDQVVILDQLCSLLSPVGEHRSRYISPCKGKRNRKRKRIATRKREDGEEVADTVMNEQDHAGQTPQPPEIAASILVGFNATERRLEAAAQRATPIGISKRVASKACEEELTPLVAVFVDRSEYPPMLHSHLPQLLAIASMSTPSEPAIRLVTLPKGSTARLSHALHIPRVSIIGLERDAPNTRPLVEFIRKHVAPMEIPWLKIIQEGLYMPVTIKSITVVSPSKTEKTSQPTGPPQAKNQRPKAGNTQHTPQENF